MRNIGNRWHYEAMYAGNLRHLLGLMSKEVAAMRHLANAQGKAQICVQDGGKKLARLKEIVHQGEAEAALGEAEAEVEAVRGWGQSKSIV